LILGIGSDLADIRRVERTLERWGERFTARVFTEVERARSERAPTGALKAASYAKRFAAKEACAKALGTGVPRRGVHWADMGVVNARSGQPTVALTGGAARRLEAITPAGLVARVHLTLTDDHPYAQAFVVIEALDPAATGSLAAGDGAG
jgi:holo-[acyl-carrier protein] synthase